MSNRLYRLDSEQSTLLLLSIEQAIPAVIYYSERLSSEFDDEMAIQLTADAIAMAKLDSRTQVALLPENSRGFFGEPGLQGHRNGQHFAHRFTVANSEQSDNQLTIQAIDESAGLTLDISITCDTASNVFSWQHSLTNTANSEFTLDHLSCPTLPLTLDQLTTLHGRWGKEFQQHTASLAHGRFQIDNRRGRTSHEHFPGLFLGDATSTELSGSAFAAHLGWSGN